VVFSACLDGCALAVFVLAVWRAVAAAVAVAVAQVVPWYQLVLPVVLVVVLPVPSLVPTELHHTEVHWRGTALVCWWRVGGL
jgi:hypothetical protein